MREVLSIVLGANEPRTKLQMAGFERAEIPLHKSQVFIAIMDGLRVGLSGFEIGSNT